MIKKATTKVKKSLPNSDHREVWPDLPEPTRTAIRELIKEHIRGQQK